MKNKQCFRHFEKPLKIIIIDIFSQAQTDGNPSGREGAEGDDLWSGECEGKKTHHVRKETRV